VVSKGQFLMNYFHSHSQEALIFIKTQFDAHDAVKCGDLSGCSAAITHLDLAVTHRLFIRTH